MAFEKMKQAQQMNDLRKQAQKMQRELRDTLIEATEADGKVKVVFTGEQSIEEVHIDPELLDPARQKELEKHIKSCVSQAIKQSQQVAAQKMQEVTGGMGLPGM